MTEGGDAIRDLAGLAVPAAGSLLETGRVSEPYRLIRRAVARKLGEASPGLIKDVIRDGTEAGIPETVYLVEAVPEDLAHELADELRPGTPAGLLARVCDEHGDPAWLLTVVAGIAAPEPHKDLANALRTWYRDERDVTSHSIPERFLRRAAAMLSPFEKGGLGTFDELALIPDVDDVYLYLKQLLFYQERGLQTEWG